MKSGKWIEWYSNVINSSGYDLSAHILNIIQLVTIILKQIEVLHNKFLLAWIQIQILTNSMFLVELLSDLFIGGFITTVLDKGRTRVELVCQIISIVALCKLVLYDSETNINHYPSI